MKPYSLHVGNLANIAYANCKILEKNNHSFSLVCHDENHLMSQPEWNDLELRSEDFPDENNFFLNTANITEHSRPSWYQAETLSSVFQSSHLSIKGRLSQFLPDYIKDKIRPFYTEMMARKAFRQKFRNLSNQPLFDLEKRIEELVLQSKAFGKDWALKKMDFYPYLPHAKWLNSKILGHNVIFSYVLAPIYCMMGTALPYVAIEIGTMREIPFENTLHAKLLALSYRRANCVLITNPDVVNQAKTLGLNNYRFLPHPVDEDIYKPRKDQSILELREKILKGSDADFLIFAPARQNWELKGNQKYIEALKILRQKGYKVKMVIPLWGQDIEKTKAHIANLGIQPSIMFIKPVSELTLIKYLNAADVVLDQFELGVFGFITCKAMACGVPVLTSYEPSTHSWCFSEHPPVVRCSTVTDIVENIISLKKPEFKNEIGNKSRTWFLKNHSSSIVANVLLETAESVLNFRSQKIESFTS